MWLSSFSWSKSSRANAAHFNSSTHSCTSAFTRLAIREAWLSRDSSNSCNPSLLAAMQNSKFLSLGTHHPLAVLSSKKNLRRVQTFAFSTPLLVTLSTLPTWVGAPNPMGVERKPFTIKLDADNAAWLAELQSACLPLEVSKSSLVNSLVTIARTQIQVTPASVQITPRNLSNAAPKKSPCADDSQRKSA